MVKKGLLILIIAVLVAGGAFAQSNTITVDVGPYIVGLALVNMTSTLTSMIENVGSIDLNGFSIAGQYERQIFRQFSVAARGVYGKYTVGINFIDEETGIRALANTGLVSWAAEGHARFYPLGDTFFLDGMLGFSQLSADLSGRFIVDVGSVSIDKPALVSESSNYLKFGGKLGWRISFGRNGGFTFEPAIGYYAGIPLGDALGKKISASLTQQTGGQVPIDEEFDLLEKYIFVGGPRVTLSFGYRF